MTPCALLGRQLHLWAAAHPAPADNPGPPTSAPATQAAVVAIGADTFGGGPLEELARTPPATPVGGGRWRARLRGTFTPTAATGPTSRGIGSHGGQAVARSQQPAAWSGHSMAALARAGSSKGELP